MPTLREHSLPTHHAPETPDATLRIHRNDLKPEVRAYADNLREQIRDIWKAHGVQNIDEFETAARTKKISRAKVKEVQGLFAQLRDAVDGKITTEILAQLKEQEHRTEERRKQAKTLFDKGWGEVLGIPTFEDYLSTIPEAPRQPEQWRGRFDRLVLVDGRIPFTKACQLADLAFKDSDQILVPFDPTKSQSGVRWMYANDGKQYRNQTTRSCRLSFSPDEVGLDAIEGISLYLHDPAFIHDYSMDLPNAVDPHSPSACASLGDWNITPEFSSRRGGFANHEHGSASRGEFTALP